ncbi:hypothetical protein ACHQM5_011604 [Ranunculus cassubicifolius]
MARDLYDSGFGVSQNASFQVPGALLLFCMILASLSMISMVLLACGDDPNKSQRGGGGVSGGGCGGGGGGGGCGGGGCGGGGCGGGG